jgi:hypothetical protein
LVQSPERDAYVLQEVAQRVGPVSIRTVYTWIDGGLLKATTIAGRRMVLRGDLEAFLQGDQGRATRKRSPTGRAKDLQASRCEGVA